MFANNIKHLEHTEDNRAQKLYEYFVVASVRVWNTTSRNEFDCTVSERLLRKCLDLRWRM
jgi:hypothetical protein